MRQLEILIVEFFTVNRFSPSSVALRKISALAHKTGNDSVKFRTFVSKALFPGTKSAEIFAGFWHNIIPKL